MPILRGRGKQSKVERMVWEKEGERWFHCCAEASGEVYSTTLAVESEIGRGKSKFHYNAQGGENGGMW